MPEVHSVLSFVRKEQIIQKYLLIVLNIMVTSNEPCNRNSVSLEWIAKFSCWLLRKMLSNNVYHIFPDCASLCWWIEWSSIHHHKIAQPGWASPASSSVFYSLKFWEKISLRHLLQTAPVSFSHWQSVFASLPLHHWKTSSAFIRNIHCAAQHFIDYITGTAKSPGTTKTNTTKSAKQSLPPTDISDGSLMPSLITM